MYLNTKNIMWGLQFLAVLMLAACGGGGGGGGGGAAPASSVGSSTTTYSIGGTVSGLTGSVVLQNNGGDNLTVSTNGVFTFATQVNNGSIYAVTVLTQPTGQFCLVTNGSGTVAAVNVANVAVSCSAIAGSPPAQPSALLATPLSESSVRVAWTDNSLDEVGFYVERSTSATGPFTQVSLPANTATYTDSGLSPSTLYYYRVAAYNTNGISPYAGAVSVTTSAPATTPPTAPSGLIATAASTTSIALSWTDNSSNESGFKIERGTSVTGPFTQIAIASANAASYTDNGLTVATTYYYQIRATNSAGDSGYTAVASVATQATATIPAAPSGLTATAASTTSMALSWKDNSTDETGFKIERGTSATGPFTQIATTSTNAASYTDTGLTAATTYYYQIRATNSAGDSTYTAVASAATPAAATVPAAPSGLAVIAASTTSIVLSWVDNSTNETGFKIERGTSATGPFTQIMLVGTNSTGYTDAGLTASTTYYYRVRATNSAGDSTYTAVASAATPALVIVPAAPSGLAAQSASTTSISLSWVDNSANETGFVVERGTSATGPFAQVGTTSANAVSYSDTGLTAATMYYYRVLATNSAGNSAYTAVAAATTSTVVTLNPALDNLIMSAGITQSTANKTYPTSPDLAVGCNWIAGFNAVTGTSYQDYLCSQSLMNFNIAPLSGKTIDSATLTLNTYYAGVGSLPRNWYIAALISSWNGTITWNGASTFTYYLTSKQTFAPPTVGQVYNINLTSVVQAWANGTWANNGLILETTSYLWPASPINSLDAFAFYSSEAGAGGAGYPASGLGLGPALTVTYH